MASEQTHMKHNRPNVSDMRDKFDKNWFVYDFEGKPWQDTVPTMSDAFIDTIQPLLQLDAMSVWNDDSTDGTHFHLYQLCQHKVYVWMDEDFATPKVPKIKESALKSLTHREDKHTVTMKTPRIVIMECLAGEVITVLHGRVELSFEFYNNGSCYYMLGAVDTEQRMVFNFPKKFKLP